MIKQGNSILYATQFKIVFTKCAGNKLVYITKYGKSLYQ